MSSGAHRITAGIGILLAVVVCPPLAAQNLSTDSGSKMVTGGTNMLFKGEEFAELLASVFVYGLLAALSDSTDRYNSFEEDCWNDDEVDIDVASVQFGTGLGYFVAPGFALGGKLLLQGGSRHNGGHTFAGVGPEVTYFMRKRDRPWMPFLGAGAFYTRGLNTDRQYRLIDSGASVLLKGGICSRASNSTGFFMQITYQRNNLRTVNGDPLASARFGLGLGFSGFFD